MSQFSTNLSDFDDEEFFRDFSPDEPQTQQDPEVPLDDSQLNHVLRSSNVKTPEKQEILQNQPPSVPDQTESPKDPDGNNTDVSPDCRTNLC